jgi:hypothetical protein
MLVAQGKGRIKHDRIKSGSEWTYDLRDWTIRILETLATIDYYRERLEWPDGSVLVSRARLADHR